MVKIAHLSYREGMHVKLHKFTFVFAVIAIVLFLIALHMVTPLILSNALSRQLGVKATVGGVHVRLNKIWVDMITVHNPKGSRLPYALVIKQVELHAPLFEYVQPKTDIKLIFLDDIYMSVEFYDKARKESNWTTILDHLNQQAELPGVGGGKSLHIGELLMKNIKVDLALYGEQVRRIRPLKEIRLRDIEPESGLLGKKLTRIITNHIVRSISSHSGIGTIQGVVVSVPTQAAKTLTAPFRWFFSFHKKRQQSEQSSEPQSASPRESH